MNGSTNCGNWLRRAEGQKISSRIRTCCSLKVIDRDNGAIEAVICKELENKDTMNRCNHPPERSISNQKQRQLPTARNGKQGWRTRKDNARINDASYAQVAAKVASGFLIGWTKETSGPALTTSTLKLLQCLHSLLGRLFFVRHF